MHLTNKHLCNRCSQIDVRFLARIHQDQEFGTGITSDQSHSASCRFCSLIDHCLKKSAGVTFPVRGKLRGHVVGQELQFSIDNRRLDYSIQPCEDIPRSRTDCLTHFAEGFSPTELKKWLRHCDEHKCLPDNSDYRKELPERFRVIDLQENCIVHPPESAEYCALSYVWGSINHFFMNEDTKNDLMSKGGIDRVKLPRTIFDAMELCRSIGCRYLWVDSLCIVQDSEEDRRSQIGLMADIYSQSYLTIIAATGDDANSGLSPYGGLGRQPVIQSLAVHMPELGSFVGTMSPQRAAQDILNSTWASRGWTLQEQSLSRRVLFFTGTHAFFRCEHSLWSEDFGLGIANHFEKAQKWTWDLPMPPFYRRKKVHGHIYPSTFKEILGEYLRRQQNLLLASDVLNAITGVLIRLKDDIGDHLWGLPSKRFSAALQWKTEQAFPIAPRPGFPSWSWSGWYHDVNEGTLRTEIQNYDMDIYKESDVEALNQSALSCWVLDSQGEIRQIETSFMDAIPSHTDQNATLYAMTPSLNLFQSPPLSLLDFLGSWQSPTASPISQHIFIWGSCATLHVDRKAFCPIGAKGGRYALRHQPGSEVIGNIELRTAWREKAGEDMEFIVTTVGNYSSQPRHEKDVRVKVLLLEISNRAEPPSPSVYRRIQVSTTSIAIGDWALCRPENKLLVLV